MSSLTTAAIPQELHRGTLLILEQLTTSITVLARTDEKGASSLPLDLAGKILTVLDVGIGDLLEVVEV